MTANMQRRKFITLIGGATAAWPRAARAQQGERVRRIGVLMAGAGNDTETQRSLTGFLQGLDRLGLAEGRNVRFDTRFAATDLGAIQPLAKELIALQLDVILATNTPIAVTFARESRTIPIVFVQVADPMGSGLVASLARPGGNITGFLTYEEGIVGKWLALLKEIAPRLTRAVLIADPKSTAYEYFLRATKVAAPHLALEVVPGRVEDATEIERVIDSFARVPNGGLVVLPDTATLLYRDLIVALAARHRLPAVYPFRFFVASGGLMSYGVDPVDHFRQASTYVDRILRGEKPADLPVQAPVKYSTVLNLKTAKTLGLSVPDLLLVRADEVIE
jgi:putative ABC transport system substrate-binding protein